jgi:hypothetical protein
MCTSILFDIVCTLTGSAVSSKQILYQLCKKKPQEHYINYHLMACDSIVNKSISQLLVSSNMSQLLVSSNMSHTWTIMTGPRMWNNHTNKMTKACIFSSRAWFQLSSNGLRFCTPTFCIIKHEPYVNNDRTPHTTSVPKKQGVYF